jgi:hypothetical protein
MRVNKFFPNDYKILLSQASFAQNTVQLKPQTLFGVDF